jgi:hypothetical protein
VMVISAEISADLGKLCCADRKTNHTKLRTSPTLCPDGDDSESPVALWSGPLSCLQKRGFAELAAGRNITLFHAEKVGVERE